MNIEDQLRVALRREPAPGGFAASVAARTQRAAWWRNPAALAVAAGLLLAAMVPVAVSEYRRERALEARAQLLQALAITRVQIRQVRQTIQRSTRRSL